MVNEDGTVSVWVGQILTAYLLCTAWMIAESEPKTGSLCLDFLGSYSGSLILQTGSDTLVDQLSGVSSVFHLSQ